MVKRRAPKRDPSLPLIKSNASILKGSGSPPDLLPKAGGSSGVNVPENTGYAEGSSTSYDVMKIKIQDLQGEISSLGKKTRETISEIDENESEIQSLHSKIELLQLQMQKLQQSKREKEGKIDFYSSKVEDLATKKKILEDALEIVGGRV
jgi:hypothetical protein